MPIPVLPPPSQKAVEIGEKVKAFLQYRPAVSEDAVHRPRESGTEGHHPAAERGAVCRLDDHVGVRVPE